MRLIDPATAFSDLGTTSTSTGKTVTVSELAGVAELDEWDPLCTAESLGKGGREEYQAGTRDINTDKDTGHMGQLSAVILHRWSSAQVPITEPQKDKLSFGEVGKSTAPNSIQAVVQPLTVKRQPFFFRAQEKQGRYYREYPIKNQGQDGFARPTFCESNFKWTPHIGT
jgi:hypothetical protein